MSENERFWILESSDANSVNKINEAAEATGLKIVGFVDEAYGGVTAYVTDEVADEYLVILNAGLDAQNGD